MKIKQPHEVAKLFTAKQAAKSQLNNVKQQLNTDTNSKHWIATDSHKMILISTIGTEPTNNEWHDIGTGEVSTLAPNAEKIIPKNNAFTPTFTTTLDDLHQIAQLGLAQQVQSKEVKRIQFTSDGDIELNMGTITVNDGYKTFTSIAFDAQQLATAVKALYEIGARQPLDIMQTGTMSQTVIKAIAQGYDIKIIIMPLRIVR